MYTACAFVCRMSIKVLTHFTYDGPYASYLHFAPEDNHASTSSVRPDALPDNQPTVSKH